MAMNENSWIKTTMLSILALGVGLSANEAVSKDKPDMEKCYGIVKKGMNECATPMHSCEGQAPKDGDPSEWIYLPKGTCKNIVNGKTEAPQGEGLKPKS